MALAVLDMPLAKTFADSRREQAIFAVSQSGQHWQDLAECLSNGGKVVMPVGSVVPQRYGLLNIGHASQVVRSNMEAVIRCGVSCKDVTMGLVSQSCTALPVSK